MRLDPQAQTAESIERREVSGAGLSKLDIFCFSCSSALVLRTLSLLSDCSAPALVETAGA